MIINMGEALIDFVPESEGTGRSVRYIPSPGGSPYNCAIAAGRLGSDVQFLGKVSTDFFGDQLVSHLTENNVGVDYLKRTADPTTLAFVQKAPGGHARYAFFTNGAADRTLQISELPSGLPDGAMLQYGSISLIPDPTSNTILSLAEREGAGHITSFDPNIRTVLVDDADNYRRRLDRAVAAASIVKVSDEDLEWIYPGLSVLSAAEQMLEAGVLLVVVTRGEEGALGITKDGTIEAGATRTDVSDTIGAGDSFHAALLHWLDRRGVHKPEDLSGVTSNGLREALTFAGKVAAITCSRPGADPPWESELK